MPGISLKSSAEGRSHQPVTPPPLELGLRNRQEFVAGYEDSAAGGGAVFCPTRRKANKGALVNVRVNLGRRQPPLLIAGRVLWPRPGRHLQKIRAGICVEFLAAERPKVEYLLDLAKAGTGVRS